MSSLPSPPSTHVPATPLLLQQWTPDATSQQKAEGNDLFFNVIIWLLVLVPMIVVFLLAVSRKRRRPQLPQVEDSSFEELETRSPLPVVVHVYSTWSIGDRVIESEVSKIAAEQAERFRVLWLDIDQNRAVQSSYPTLSPRSVALFQKGRLLWQSVGVQPAEEMLREMEETLESSCRASPDR